MPTPIELQAALAKIQQRAQTGCFLIVDDFDTMRRVTANLLKQLGVTNFKEAGNGVSAMRILSTEPVSVILSDWNMPMMNGLEFLIAVRMDPRWYRLPFLMITAEAERDRVKQAIQLGVTELLVKPYNGGRFAACVSHALQTPTKLTTPLTASAVEAIAPGVLAGQALSKLFASNAAQRADLASLGTDAVMTSPEGTIGAEPDVTSKPQAPVAATKKDKSLILIVDDTPDNLTLLSHIFMEDFKVKLAGNGTKAIQIAQSDTPPDLILLDIMMPDMDGFEVAKRLREHPTSENIPIIFVTAMTDDAARLKGMALGAVDFVTKPVDPDGLRMRVANFMRYVELHRQLQSDYDSMLEMERLKSDVDLITRHDMKSPLAAVLGLAQTAAADNNLGEAAREQFKLIEDATLQALNMISLSTELYKIETGSFELHAKPLPLASIIRKIVAMMKKAFAEKNLNFHTLIPEGVPESELAARGEEIFCYSVLENLMKNACEAAPDGSAINVQMFSETPRRVTIENTGVVPTEIRNDFFAKFNSVGKQGGTGLGTYSAKLLVEAQLGEIAMITSDESGKTLLTVTLPAA